MKKIISWVVFALVVFGVFKAAQAFKNPWNLPSPAAMVLPAASTGCADSRDCFHD